MATKIYCDRCGKEIKMKDSDAWEWGFEVSSDTSYKPKKLSKPQTLCKKCMSGYNKILKCFEKEVKKFMRDGKK